MRHGKRQGGRLTLPGASRRLDILRASAQRDKGKIMRVPAHAIDHAASRMPELDCDTILSVDAKQRREYAVPVRHMRHPMSVTEMSNFLKKCVVC